MSTFKNIASTTISSPTTTVTFSSIPSTYTDLFIVGSARSNRSFAQDFINVDFNSIQSIYSESYFSGLGPGNVIAVTVATNEQFLGASASQIQIPAANATSSNIFGHFQLYIPSYTSDKWKPLNVVNVKVDNTNTSNTHSYNKTAGLARTISAISSINIKCSQAQFIADSAFYLYGIKNT
jgi:hypothetical protein